MCICVCSIQNSLHSLGTKGESGFVGFKGEMGDRGFPGVKGETVLLRNVVRPDDDTVSHPSLNISFKGFESNQDIVSGSLYFQVLTAPLAPLAPTPSLKETLASLEHRGPLVPRGPQASLA